MINRLKISNFKSLRELEVEFGRLTVIVGPNGCGKSSLLQAILALRDLVRGYDGGAPRFPYDAYSRGPAPDQVASSVEFELHIDHAQFAGNVVADKSGGLLRESLGFFNGDELGLSRVPPPLAAWSNHVELYQFDKSIMERPAYAHEPNPVLGRRGENLPAVLDALQGERRDHFVAIESVLCKFILGLQRIGLRRVMVPTGDRSQGVGHQVIFDFEHAHGVPADQASEGTVLLLGLLTVIGTEPGPPTTIMLDDLDRGLHPKAQKQLIGHLRKLLEQRPDLQIIATTHSPYLVEHLEYEEVLAMTQSSEDGRSLIAPLASHPDVERWRDEMSAGEFWSSVGEDWVAGER